MEEKTNIEAYRNLFDMPRESQLFEETLSLLQRATSAREVAEVVAKLFDVGSINSDRVVTKDFINILTGVAVQLKKGNSVNNIREHINTIITRDRWKTREKESRQNQTLKFSGDTVTINIPITFDRDKFALMQDIIHQLDLVLSRVDISHFDGNPDTATPVCQLQGTAPVVAAALRQISVRLGTDSLADIRYISDANGFEREHLTLQQTIQLAENEN